MRKKSRQSGVFVKLSRFKRGHRAKFKSVTNKVKRRR